MVAVCCPGFNLSLQLEQLFVIGTDRFLCSQDRFGASFWTLFHLVPLPTPQQSPSYFGGKMFFLCEEKGFTGYPEHKDRWGVYLS
jgi:hypothetical protein